jgi:Uncharacterised nucleotidyltransferase
MNRSLRQAILDELNIATCNARTPVPWKSFSTREWDQAFAWLDLSGLAIYFLHRMAHANSLAAIPDGQRRNLERRSSDNHHRTDEMVQELGLLSESLQRAGVQYAVLKGLALVPDYCPDPALRTQYDHDILVSPKSLTGAENVLQSAGYRRKRNHDNESAVIVYRQPEPEIRFTQTSQGLYSSLLRRSVELHLTLWEETEDKIRVNLSDDFLERSRPRDCQGLRFMALCDEDSLLFQVLHAFRHILRNWCRLSIFLEIAYFLNQRSSDSAFWEGFACRVRNIKWAPEASLVVFTLATQLFGGNLPQQLLDSVKTGLSPALSLWTERYGRRSALANFRADKCSLFLHREFVDDDAEWSTIRRRRLFPVRRPHRPPAVVFQRGFSTAGRVWMESVHALRRLRFHGMSDLRYYLEYPRWIFLRRLRLAESEEL